MKSEDLFEIFHNSGVSAIALHSFTLGYYNVAKHNDSLTEKYPHLPNLFYVLPIVYNKNAMNIFGSSNQLYSAILKDKTVILGLQDRANKLSQQTFDGLNLAFNKQILLYNKNNRSIELGKGFTTKKLPLTISQNNFHNSIKKIQDCAFKLGGIFAKRSKSNIQFELNIKL